MNFCNKDKVVSPVEKRKAPAISVDLFKSYLTDYYNMNVGLGDTKDYITDATPAEKNEFIKKIFKSRSMYDCKGFYGEMQFISDDPSSKIIRSADTGTDTLLGITVLPNGIPIYGFLLGGEIEKPYYAMMYFNGSCLRFFIPESGNTINSDFYTAFGSEGYTANENPQDIIDEYERILGKSLDDIKSAKIAIDQLEYWQPAIAYCLKHNYAKTEDSAVEVIETLSWKYILNDILSILEESDEKDDLEESEKEETEEDSEEKEWEFEPDDEDEEDEEEDELECEEEDDFVEIETLSFSSPSTKEDEILKFKKIEIPGLTEDDNFCNRKRSMIRFGKLSLPSIKPEKFREKLNEYYDTTDRVMFDYSTNPIILAKNIMRTSGVIIDVDFATIKESESRIFSKTGKPLLGFNVLPNGIPFFGMEVGQNIDSELNTFFVALFWNGSSIIPYIPSYGNTYNVDMQTVFGKEQESLSVDKYIKIYEKKCKEKIPSDKKSLTIYYFKSKGYDISGIEELKHSGSWNGILEDLCFAIQVKSKSR